MKKLILILFSFFFTLPAFAGDYNYVSQDKVKKWIETDTPVMIVDIQVEEEFRAHHIKGSVATYSYPVKSDADKAKLADAVAQARGNDQPVVIVCPRGKGGAKRCYDHMAANGIAKDRLLILEKGMGGWSYKEMVEAE